ncbi:MAG: hypothetical protein Q9217_004037 [Psora testacea]
MLLYAALHLVLAVIPHEVLTQETQYPLKNAAPAIDDKSVQKYDTEQLLSSNLDLLSKDSLLHLHKTLVSIPSTSGSENAIALFLQHYLPSLNLTVELQSVPPLSINQNTSNHNNPKQRYNVFAHPPSRRQTPLLLTTHIDTVPPHIPYSFQPPDEIWGRGTVDAKACIATQLFAYAQLVASSAIAAEDASFLFVVGEEIGGDGMSTANELGLEWETVIFGEPTELKLASGHKGLLLLEIRARGKGGHSGYPELGESAIDMLLSALVKLKEVQMPSSAKYGNTTINIGLVRGGVAENVIAQTADAGIGIRIAAGDPEMVRNIVLETVKSVHEKLEVQFSHGRAYGPVDIDADVPNFETITVNYGTDIPNLKGNHKRYLYGPGSILVAHSDHEHLKVQDLYDAVDGYMRLIRHALGQGPSCMNRTVTCIRG